MSPAAGHHNDSGEEEGLSVWPFSSFLLFLAWLGLMSSVAVSLGFFLVAGDVPSGLVVANGILVGVLVVAGVRPGDVEEPLRRCEACRHAQEPTRCPSQGRLWTCFACGQETPRLRRTHELWARP